MSGMPPTSAKAVKPVQRLPTSNDMASKPASCTKASPGIRSINLAAALMQPASTNALGREGTLFSALAKILEIVSQPTATWGPPPAAAFPATTKRSAMMPGSVTSFSTSCAKSFGMASFQANSPPLAVRMSIARGPSLPGARFAGAEASGPLPSSAATIRAAASPAFKQASAAGPEGTDWSFGSGRGAVENTASTAPKMPGTESLVMETDES
mmetsp:Transcript_117761/g.375418  ORF Transcript_117761/g.375418 Transcript_117761/m.375418 type:complete len:212 (+) Transcript_117761:555-1190(+)